VTVSIHQPNFLPWLGFFDKVYRADMFILLDNVQFEKNGWQNRNRIKGPDGPQWLTVPVYHRFPQTIPEVQIDNRTDWRRKHWQAIVSNYGKAPYFNRYGPLFEAAYRRPWDRLLDINLHLLRLVFEILDLRTPCALASEYPVDGASSERLAALCRAVGGDAYLAGAGGHAYLDPAPFEASGIRVEFQSYHHPVYPQRFGPFASHLSVIDLVMHCGDRSLAVIKGQAYPGDSV
jgi:hypothetical protein